MTGHLPVIGIVGLGTVGEALLRLLRATGHQVIGVDSDPEVLTRLRTKGLDAAGPPLGEAATRGLPADALTAVGLPTRAENCVQVTLTDDMTPLNRAELVIEAVSEDRIVKVEVLRLIRATCLDGTVVVSTTSALPLSRLAVASGMPADTVGLRFLVPPTPGGPVEVVRTSLTSVESVTVVNELVSRLGLTQVVLDARAGADATALMFGYLNRAVSLYEQRGAARDDIDTAMRLGCGLPYGPLELLDRIGLDSALAVLRELRDRTDDASFTPAASLTEMVAAGRLGRKAGSGFYDYDGYNDDCDADGSDTAAAPAEAAGTGGTAPEQAHRVRRIGVLGSGTMARGIAEVAATAGFPTVLVGRGTAGVGRALRQIEESLTRGVRRGRVSPGAKAAAAELLSGADDITALADCDLVVEAVVEDIEVKRSLFARLGEVCGPDALLATTTSSLSVTACAEASGRPERVLGMHFFNPAPVMKLVELVRTGATSDEAAAAARLVCERLGKTAVDCPDRTGFIVNHLLFPYLGSALRLLDRYDADVEDIDSAVEQGFGHPMGPFALLDAIGLDISLAILRELYETFERPEFAPPALIEQLVADGWLGRKNGKGFRTTKWGTGADSLG
ncbi:3-hydroxyacyl-CoA dehydrogenase family protein [Streptomyces sp. H27-D2]|uniref:3-hydroxyacyl-CoA dehydrogenase family protein n=1 Tax=Streptomyces sp. H27-D2 TaxID=3046304 RepID=UPI002DBD1F69|nr:3-hydroxyacyl-CoA dehydrogenase NAD-binding domain-containing protein [Streptomyces sp. H27-D2]MEC4018734.1 3-hydroxyacyl-CoA dehydrogenase NAD-binding domain-containing protein [Streptomyces sp. H27-D2]